MTNTEILIALFNFYAPWVVPMGLCAGLFYELHRRREFKQHIAARRCYTKQRMKAIHNCEM